VTTVPDPLFEFMPYGAPELKAVARKYMLRALAVGCSFMIALILAFTGTRVLMEQQAKETSVIVVPYTELAAPPPLTEKVAPPKVEIAKPTAPPTVGVAVPVPDAEAEPEQTIASQEELADLTPSVTQGEGDGDIVVAPPDDDALPAFGDYVYVEELPEAITKVPPEYPDIAREAGVDGTVLIQALVGKDGRVKDTKVVQSIPMLDAAAVDAVAKWVFKPALSNNRPVAVWVAVPVRFTLH